MALFRLPERKYEPYLFYDQRTGWYFKILIITHLWMLGPKTEYQPDGLWFSVGPIHLSIAHDSLSYGYMRERMKVYDETACSSKAEVA